jgi:hypothetical protein
MIERLQATHHGHKRCKTLGMSGEDIEVRTKGLNIRECQQTVLFKSSPSSGKKG